MQWRLISRWVVLANTVLHLLAAAQKEIDFDMDDVDAMSHRYYVKWHLQLPNTTWKTFTRAGGVMAILGELDRAGLLDNQTRTVLGLSMQEQLAQSTSPRQKMKLCLSSSVLALRYPLR